MNKYVIAVRTQYPKRYNSKVEHKYLADMESLTETVECAIVGKKVTMRNLMKSLHQAHRVADKKYAAENVLQHVLHHRMKLVKYERAYARETIQRVLDC